MVFELGSFFVCLFNLFFKLLLIIILCAADACVIPFTRIGAFQCESLGDNESIAVGSNHAVGVDFVTCAFSAKESLLLRYRELIKLTLAFVNAYELSMDRTRRQKLKDHRKDQNCSVTPADLHF